MNPLTPASRTRRVLEEVTRIRHAWPTAQITYLDQYREATVVIEDPGSTYVIKVQPADDGVATRSLWVSHRVPIGPDSEHVPQWTEGWVD